MLKSLTVWIKTHCRKFLNKWEYQNALPVSWETSTQIKNQRLEPDMSQRTGSKLGKKYVKAVYCHPTYLTYMKSEYIMWNARLDEWQAGIKTKERNINNHIYADDTTLTAES